jgi:hypothetical protein
LGAVKEMIIQVAGPLFWILTVLLIFSKYVKAPKIINNIVLIISLATGIALISCLIIQLTWLRHLTWILFVIAVVFHLLRFIYSQLKKNNK